MCSVSCHIVFSKFSQYSCDFVLFQFFVEAVASLFQAVTNMLLILDVVGDLTRQLKLYLVTRVDQVNLADRQVHSSFATTCTSPLKL